MAPCKAVAGLVQITCLLSCLINVEIKVNQSWWKQMLYIDIFAPIGKR